METQEKSLQKLLDEKKMEFTMPFSITIGIITGLILKNFNFPLWIVLITMGIIVVIVTKIMSRIVENKFYKKRYEEKINKIKDFFDYVDNSLYHFDPKNIFETKSSRFKHKTGRNYYSYTLFEALKEIEWLGNSGKFEKMEKIHEYDFHIFTKIKGGHDYSFYNITIEENNLGLSLKIRPIKYKK